MSPTLNMTTAQPSVNHNATRNMTSLKEVIVLEFDTDGDDTAVEDGLSFLRAVKQYPSATFWAAFFNIAVAMVGFDAQVITSFFVLPAFQRNYGNLVSNGSYEISARWQLALGLGTPIGQILGALAGGLLMERFTRRSTLAACCVYSIVFTFIQFFATSIGMLCAGEVLGGLAYGFYLVIAPTYASEVCPPALRGVLTASINLAFVIGQFTAQGCTAGLETRLDEWSYRIPFVCASQFVVQSNESY